MSMLQMAGSPAVNSPLIEFDNIYMRTDRGEDLFRGLKFTLQNGRSAVIIGGAGSGKTTLVELMVGLSFPVSGKVTLFGETMRRRRRVIRKTRLKIGGVGGPFGLIDSLTVAENILLPLILIGERKQVRRERLTHLLGEFSLLNQAGQYPPSLTRVESALVMIARASIANQPLMVIDEPAAGLDQKTYLKTLEYLVKASLAGRSMLILASEKPPIELPHTDYYTLSGGALV